jgi:hypothetical protein
MRFPLIAMQHTRAESLNRALGVLLEQELRARFS